MIIPWTTPMPILYLSQAESWPTCWWPGTKWEISQHQNAVFFMFHGPRWFAIHVFFFHSWWVIHIAYICPSFVQWMKSMQIVKIDRTLCSCWPSTEISSRFPQQNSWEKNWHYPTEIEELSGRHAKVNQNSHPQPLFSLEVGQLLCRARSREVGRITFV